MQVKRHVMSYTCVGQSGQSGKALFEALSASPVLSRDKVRCCALVGDASDVLLEGAVACISLFISLVLIYVVTRVLILL